MLQRSNEMVIHRKTGQSNFRVILKLSCDFKDERAHLLANETQDTPTMPTLCMFFCIPMHHEWPWDSITVASLNESFVALSSP